MAYLVSRVLARGTPPVVELQGTGVPDLSAFAVGSRAWRTDAPSGSTGVYLKLASGVLQLPASSTGGSGTPVENATTAAAGIVLVNSNAPSGAPVVYRTSEVDTLLAAKQAAYAAQAANRVLAGPTTGANAAPAFRALVAADIPALGYEATGTAAAAVSAHVALSDPHPQYALDSEKGAANGLATLGSDGKVPSAQLPAASGVAAHASTHASGGSDAVTLAQSQITNLVSDLAGKQATLAATFGRLTGRTVLTSTTAATYTVPAGVRSLLVEAWGGGGAGGSSAGAASAAGFAGGGGSGAYGAKYIGTPAASYAYQCGAAGAAGAAGNTVGGTGGSTTFGSPAVLTAPGGAGGAGSGTAAATPLAVAPGAGGAVATGGDINLAGSPGAPGVRFSGTVGMSGSGAVGAYGQGGGLARVAAGAGNAAGANNAGGAGAASIAAGNFAGGVGGAGLIIVWEFS